MKEKKRIDWKLALAAAVGLLLLVTIVLSTIRTRQLIKKTEQVTGERL
ncbi:MAG: hypothetical protein SPJ13_02980 [Bacteroidales bacterium]|nr:hypothetical protein [Bacteroidales bacterium]